MVPSAPSVPSSTNGHPRADRSKVREEERKEGKWCVRFSGPMDPSYSSRWILCYLYVYPIILVVVLYIKMIFLPSSLISICHSPRPRFVLFLHFAANPPFIPQLMVSMTLRMEMLLKQVTRQDTILIIISLSQIRHSSLSCTCTFEPDRSFPALSCPALI